MNQDELSDYELYCWLLTIESEDPILSQLTGDEQDLLTEIMEDNEDIDIEAAGADEDLVLLPKSREAILKLRQLIG